MISVHLRLFAVLILWVMVGFSSVWAGPKIHCGAPVWDFGERMNGGELEVTTDHPLHPVISIPVRRVE
jgi:hypothetical protein